MQTEPYAIASVTNRAKAVAVIYGVSVLCAVVIISASATHSLTVYDLIEGLGFGVLTSAIPFGLIYARRVAAAYVSALIINFLLVAQATAPTVAGASLFLLIVFGTAYYFFAPVRDAIQLFLYKRKPDGQSDK